MVKRITIGIAALLVIVVAIVLILAAMKPDTFRVQRSTTIKASPDKIFPLINDFQAWKAWSPYEGKDPAMKRSYSDPSSGKGARYAWEGDHNVGQGSMEIADTAPPSKVVLKLDFVRPFEAHNIVEFTLAPKGDMTDVTWAITGDTPYLSKIIHVFFNIDSMVGKDFETGLANLRTVAER